MMNKVTLADVARVCDVDISTASRAIRSDVRVKEKTQIQVKKAAERLGYKPNLLARNLAGGKTNTIWMILPSIDESLDAKLVRFVSRYANLKDYSPYVAMHDADNFGEMQGHSIEHYVKIVDTACQGIVDGAIVLPRRHEMDFEILSTFIKNDFPFVFIDNYVEGIPAPLVTTDQESGVLALINQSLKEGVKEFILCFDAKNPIETKRLAAARSYLQSKRIPFTEIKKAEKDWSVAKCGKSIAVLASAQFYIHEFMLQQAKHLLNKKIVLGVFDEWLGEPSPAQKVFVALQDCEKIAQEAVDLLISRIQGKSISKSLVKKIPIQGCQVIEKIF